MLRYIIYKQFIGKKGVGRRNKKREKMKIMKLKLACYNLIKHFMSNTMEFFFFQQSNFSYYIFINFNLFILDGSRSQEATQSCQEVNNVILFLPCYLFFLFQLVFSFHSFLSFPFTFFFINFMQSTFLPFFLLFFFLLIFSY